LRKERERKTIIVLFDRSIKKRKKMSSLYSMNNHHHNYEVDDTNYSNRQQLSDNNVNVNNSSCILQSSPIIDYYGQDSFNQTSSSRHIPIYNNHLYQDNSNQFYRYNVLSSTTPNQSR
jgi:hypothetical protein